MSYILLNVYKLSKDWNIYFVKVAGFIRSSSIYTKSPSRWSNRP